MCKAKTQKSFSLLRSNKRKLTSNKLLEPSKETYKTNWHSREETQGLNTLGRQDTAETH